MACWTVVRVCETWSRIGTERLWQATLLVQPIGEKNMRDRVRLAVRWRKETLELQINGEVKQREDAAASWLSQEKKTNRGGTCKRLARLDGRSEAAAATRTARRSVFSLHRLKDHKHIRRGSLSTSAHLGLAWRRAQRAVVQRKQGKDSATSRSKHSSGLDKTSNSLRAKQVADSVQG
jgi:hypothetical protein